MAQFNKTTTATTESETVKGTPRVTRCNLVSLEKQPWITAFANIIYEGTVFMNNIAVRTNKDGDAYITFPSKKRMKDGVPVLDEAGKEIYDAYYGTADKETRAELEKMIFEAVQDKMDGKPAKDSQKGENKAIVNLVEKDGLVAFANIVFTGKFFMTGISVNEVQSGEKKGDAYITFPSKKRMKDGVPVLDEAGKPIYDAYYGPGTPEDLKKMEAMIFPAVQDEIDKTAK